MPPKLKGLQHIALKVRDLKESLRFYTEVLGFRVIEHIKFDDPIRGRSSITFITCTDLHHVMNLTELAPEARPENPPPPENTRTRREYGFHHFAFEVEDKKTFDAWEKHLRENGIEFTNGPLLHSPTHPEGDGTWGENRAMYFCDPDGNAVEICCDMMVVDENGEVDPAWHATRVKSDGFDPAKVPIPPLTR